MPLFLCFGNLFFVIVGVVRYELSQRFHMIAFFIQELHRILQAGLKSDLIFFKQPHNDSPAYSGKQIIAVALLNKINFPTGAQIELSQFPVEHGGQSDYHSAEQIEHNLVVYSCFFAENQCSKDESGQEMIKGGWLDQMVEQFVAGFVAENEEAKVFAVLQGHRTYIFEKSGCLFQGDIPEKQGHDECVHKSHFASILKTISQPFQQRENFLLKVGHALEYNNDDVKPLKRLQASKS